MSYSIGVNILLYASDRDSARHARAVRFLRERAADPDLLHMAWVTLMSYVRMSTHPRIFARPLSPSEAMRNVASLAELPQVRLMPEGAGFLDVYRDVTKGFPVRGNLVPDAHLAALLRQYGVSTLYTGDADFRKFDFLDVRDPFA